MKDHILIGHLTKIDTFNVNRGQAMDLETWFKIHTNISHFETATQVPPISFGSFVDFGK